MRLTIEGARELVVELASPGARWPAHSEKVAEVALLLALAARSCELEVDVEFVEAAALVHDVGRSITQHPSLHGIEGFRILIGKGYPEVARVCLTHVLKGRTLREAVEEGQLPQSATVGIFEEALAPMSIEDQIVATADAMVMDVRVVSLDVRYAASRSKHADVGWMSGNERRAREMAANLERLLGRQLATIVGKTTTPKSG